MPKSGACLTMRIASGNRAAVEDRIFLGIGVVGLATARLLKSGLFIKTSRGSVRFSNFQKHALAVCFARLCQQCVQETSSQSSSEGAGRDHDVFQFPFLGN